ncbi:protein kinase [Streptomyces griseosporeus]|uniref:protein kinase domain-containing protein n=1 Tax=Streptomyces griseosporeus TaxID=1910 RepID=UPI0036F66CC9
MKARPSAAPPTPVPADEQPSELLSGRYRLGARIGSGGMADVYEGVDTRLRRSVAVKVFRPGPDPQTEDRLTAEAVLLARLQHPGLVTVYDAGRHDDRTYLVMQLIKGPTLRSLLASGALPERRVVEVGAALARVLAYVHRSGVVHRDIKPSNILLDPAGAPHLADFGIARLADATRHTAPDVLIGTAAYLAPEQVKGRQIGPAADVYALGLVLLECLKGELEYQGTPLEATVARLHRPPDVPTWLPPELAALLRAMTAQAPEARPTAEQCAQALASHHTEPGTHPAEAGLPMPLAAPPETKEHIRTPDPAVTHRNLPARTRHGRRLAVGAALAVSVALGATLAVTSSTSGSDDGKASTPASTSAHPPSGTATTKSGPGAPPPTWSHGAQPSSGTSGASDPAAAATGSHAQPVSRTLGASDPTAAPGSPPGTSAPPTSTWPPGSTSPSTPTETAATDPSRPTPAPSPTTSTASPSPRPSKGRATTGAPPTPSPKQ